MKSILIFSIFCSCGFICFGQQKIVPKSFKVDTTLFNNIKHFQIRPFGKQFTDGVVILPLDNMPCLLANEKLIVPIPNAVTKNDVVNNIPNPLQKQD